MWSHGVETDTRQTSANSHEFDMLPLLQGLWISQAQRVVWMRPLSVQLSGQWCICSSARMGLAESLLGFESSLSQSYPGTSFLLDWFGLGGSFRPAALGQ